MQDPNNDWELYIALVFSVVTNIAVIIYALNNLSCL